MKLKKKTEMEKIGDRFRMFREDKGLAQHKMASELNISQSTIANIERGKAFPNIHYLHFLYFRYSLNINWLITGYGEMEVIKQTVDSKYNELLKFMQVPVIEQIILAKLVELKVLLNEAIRDYEIRNNIKLSSGDEELNSDPLNSFPDHFSLAALKPPTLVLPRFEEENNVAERVDPKNESN